MWFFLLLLQSLIGLGFSDNRLLIHQANVARLKCDALPFRSMYDDFNCYFAVSAKEPFESGSELCHSILFGAVMDTTTASKPVLNVLLVDPGNYHSKLTRGQSKSVLCKYESPSTCNHGEVRGILGKCVTRLDKPMTFKEANPSCDDLENSKLVTIHNDDENKAFANIIADHGGAWIDQPSFDLNFGAGVTEKIQYLRWFMGESGKRCATNTAINMLASKKGPCANSGYWQQSSETSKAFAFCARPGDGDFTPVEKKGPTTPTSTTTTKSPVDLKRLKTACDYTPATNRELCAHCQQVTMENIGEGLRARCGSGKLLVFVPQNSIQPRFSNKFMECNLTSGGWIYNGQLAGQSIRMGCAWNEGKVSLPNGFYNFKKKIIQRTVDAYMTPYAKEDEKDGGGVAWANEKVLLHATDNPSILLGAVNGFSVTMLNRKTDAEKWTPIFNGGTSWSFQSYNGRYVNPTDDGTVSTTQTWNRGNEMFQMEPW